MSARPTGLTKVAKSNFKIVPSRPFTNWPCCWSMRTTPRPAFAKCSLTIGSATFCNTTWSKKLAWGVLLVVYLEYPNEGWLQGLVDIWKFGGHGNFLEETSQRLESHVLPYLVLFSLTQQPTPSTWQQGGEESVPQCSARHWHLNVIGHYKIRIVFFYEMLTSFL